MASYDCQGRFTSTQRANRLVEGDQAGRTGCVDGKKWTVLVEEVRYSVCQVCAGSSCCRVVRDGLAALC